MILYRQFYPIEIELGISHVGFWFIGLEENNYDVIQRHANWKHGEGASARYSLHSEVLWGESVESFHRRPGGICIPQGVFASPKGYLTPPPDGS